MANLFAPKAKPITPQPPAVMPDPDMAGADAKRKAQRDVLARAGRASTILTSPRKRREETNYDSFSATTLSS